VRLACNPIEPGSHHDNPKFSPYLEQNRVFIARVRTQIPAEVLVQLLRCRSEFRTKTLAIPVSVFYLRACEETFSLPAVHGKRSSLMRAWLFLACSYLAIGFAAIFEHEWISRFLLDTAAPALRVWWGSVNHFASSFRSPSSSEIAFSFHQTGGTVMCAAGLVALCLMARVHVAHRRALARRRGVHSNRNSTNIERPW
jgi:hypothetical protein